MLSDGARRMLDGRCFAHLATLQPDGSPKVEPVWIGREGDRLLIATDRRTLKGRNMARDPRVAITVVDRDNPYRAGQLRGQVEGTLTGEEADALVDAMSVKFTGDPFPMRDNTVYLVAVDSSRFAELPFADTPG